MNTSDKLWRVCTT